MNDYTKRGEVMNPPESAAQGSEAGNLNTPHRDGTGAVPGREAKGVEVQATQLPAAPALPELLDLDELRNLCSDVMEMDDVCIYFLWAGDELLYIGGTTQPCDRIGRHIRDRNYCSAQNGRPVPFNRYTLLAVPDRRQLWKLETAYQKHYDPPYNTVSYRRRQY